MTPTPTARTLVRHELVGLPVRVTAARDPTLVGIGGEVVAETTNTLGIEASTRDRVRQVPKAVATFSFDLPDGPRVRVDGDRLRARPARRTETDGDSTWR